MSRKRVFISFDFVHDEGQKHLFVGQSRNSDSPFDLADWSSKEHLTGDWKTKIKQKLAFVDVACVMCGLNTHRTTGVACELAMARDLKIPYFLLNAYGTRLGMMKPTSALTSDNIYDWTWPNLKLLIGGTR